ncbi:MAG: transposase [Candidatus Marinimicrobia bacterium]|nr:transposase [Candidatus Neomarinimicrobiota bacterium]
MRCTSDIFEEGSIFHIYNHAIDNFDLFYEDEDYDFFLYKFSTHQRKIPSSVFAYCLMPDHYHFLIKQDSKQKIYKIFNYAFISYAKYFNKKYNRKGPIFSSPLQHKIINNNIYLLQLSKYIHMNPVRKNLVDLPEQWEYSDYQNWINESEGKFLSLKARKNICANSKKYQDFINSYSNFLNHYEFRNLTFRKF